MIMSLDDFLLGRPAAERYVLRGYFSRLEAHSDGSDNRNRARTKEDWMALIARLSGDKAAPAAPRTKKSKKRS